MSIIHTKSTLTSLIFNGKLVHLLRPWHVLVDIEQQSITIKKRNWHLISYDINTFSFGYIRNVNVDTHLFGADLYIHMASGLAEVFCINKRIAKHIQSTLMKFNAQKDNRHIVFH